MVYSNPPHTYGFISQGIVECLLCRATADTFRSGYGILQKNAYSVSGSRWPLDSPAISGIMFNLKCIDKTSFTAFNFTVGQLCPPR
jgi:hypothetical protein